MIYLSRLTEAQKAILPIIREAASKVLKQDDSLSQLRSRLQDELSSEHMYAGYDQNVPYDEQGYPYVVDIFGDKDTGTVVYSVDDDYFSASYKRTQDGDGDKDGFDIGEPIKVDRAYVPSAVSVAEALHDMPVGPGVDDVAKIMERYISQKTRNQMPKDDFAGKGTSFPIRNPGDVKAAVSSIGRAGAGNHSTDMLKSNITAIAMRKGMEKHLPKSWRMDSGEPAMKRESLVNKDGDTVEESINIQESAFDSDGYGEIKLIGVGSGSMGHYTEECLRKAESDNVFDSGLQMFLDHPTEDDMRRSGTGSVLKSAAVLRSPAKFQENGKEGPGLYASVKAYPDKIEFLNARSKDIGVSVAAAVKPSKQKIDGIPVVEKFIKALSCDFVSKAGAGGKIVHMYESFRERPGQQRPSAAENNNRRTEMEINEKELTTLRESAAMVPQLKLRLDRNSDLLERYQARDIVSEALATSRLPERGKKRVTEAAIASIPHTDDGSLDITKLKESVKTLMADELAYLQEAGFRPSTVTNNGGINAEMTEGADDAILQESAKVLDAEINGILGKESK